MISCSICGRTLTDETSVARGIGPECWIGHLNDQAGQGNLFASEALYDYYLRDESVLCIVDLCAPKSVATDIRRILREITSIEGDLPTIVIYKDGYGMWDGVEHVNGEFTQFYPVGTRNINEALKKVSKHGS